jgi:hypothetical protein
MHNNNTIAKAVKLLDLELKTVSRTLEQLQTARTALAGPVPINGRRPLSAAARRRIGDAQRLRWAKAKRKKAA